VRGWLGIVAGAVVFATTLALGLDDAALLLAVALLMRGGRTLFDGDASGDRAVAYPIQTPTPGRSSPRG
jgi:hypothetical protein